STIGLILLKSAILPPMARLFGAPWPAAIGTGLLLGPGGEFAFIVIATAMATGLIEPATGGTILTVVAFSMALLPALSAASIAISRKLAAGPEVPAEIDAAPPGDEQVRAIV